MSLVFINTNIFLLNSDIALLFAKSTNTVNKVNMENLKNICKNLVEVLMNLNKTLLKNRHLLIKSSIYLICALQLIQLMMDYTQYDMKNEYRASKYIIDISFTFCVDQDNLLAINPKISIDGEFIDIEKALFISKRNYRGKYCHSFTKNENYSFNFNSINNIIIGKYFFLYFESTFTMWLFAYPDIVPSHFGKIYFLNPKKQKLIFYNVQSEYSISQLLPSPF